MIQVQPVYWWSDEKKWGNQAFVALRFRLCPWKTALLPERCISEDRGKAGEKKRQGMVTRAEPPGREMLLHIQHGLQRQAHAPEDGHVAAHATGEPRAVR